MGYSTSPVTAVHHLVNRPGRSTAASRWTGLRVAAWLAIAIGGALPAAAQDAPPPAAASPTTAADPVPAPQPPGGRKEKPPEKIFRWEDHPSLHLGKGTRIDFRARFQGDVRSSEAPFDDNEEVSGVDIARRRVGVAGEIRNVIDFQVEAELGSDDSPWRDLYANYRQFDVVQVQGGKFKLPFSLDENTSATNLDFVYRSRAASQLAPGRDIGVMVHGRVMKRFVSYELGVFDHDGRNARTRDSDRVFGGQTVAGRVTVQPFRTAASLLSDLQLGVAFTGSDLDVGYADLRGRTGMDARFFRPDFWVSGRRQRRGVEMRWRPGPASIKAEYIRVSDERRGQSVEDTDLSPLIASGWYVSGTWAVTGEKKSRGLDTPSRPLFQGGFGAVEIALRTEKLMFASEASDEGPSASPRANVIVGNAVRVETFGVNWYLNRWAKVQFNLVRDSVTDPAQGPLPSQRSFWSRVLRFQVSI